MYYLNTNQKNKKCQATNHFQFDAVESLHPAVQQLFALGYKQNVNFGIRCIPKDSEKYPINFTASITENNGIRLTRLKRKRDGNWYEASRLENGLERLHELNEHGYGIYYNVNAGRENQYVERVYASIYECDFGSLEQQREKIASLPIKPTLSVWSGGKSIHVYFAIKESDGQEFEKWQQLQQHIALATGSDPALKDYTRLLRLAGFKHQSKGNVAKIEQFNPDTAYSLGEIEAAFESYYPYNENRYRLYQVFSHIQSRLSNTLSDLNVSFDNEKMTEYLYGLPEESLEVEIERWRLIRFYLTKRDLKTVKQLRNESCEEIWERTVNKRAREKTQAANRTYTVNSTGFATLNEYFASKYCDDFKEKGRGDQWSTARCPVHGGNSSNSLHINRVNGALKCHGGCDQNEIEKFLRDVADEHNDPYANKDFFSENHIEWQKRKKFTSDRQINQQFLDSSIANFDEFGKIFAVKSGLGTGKTATVGEIKKQIKGRWFAFGNSNNLLIQTANRLGMTHLVSEDEKYGIDYGNQLIGNHDVDLALCYDSIHRFTPGDFDGCNLLLDETTAGLRHLLKSSTTVSERLEESQRLFKEALQRSCRVFALDGNLSDESVELLKQLSGKRVEKIENTHQSPLTINIVERENRCDEDGNEKGHFKHDILYQKMLTMSTAYVCCDSKNRANAIKQFLENQGREVFLVTGDTVATRGDDERYSQFLANPNEFIRAEQPEFIVASPAIKEGIDINIENYFDAVFGIFQGIIGTDAAMQMYFRIRDKKAERWLWAAPFFNINLTPLPSKPERYKQQRLWEITCGYFASKHEKGETEADKEFKKQLKELFPENDPFTDYVSKIETCGSYERESFRDTLYERLRGAGHNLQSTIFDALEVTVRDAFKSAKQEAKDAEAERIYNREPILDDDERDHVRTKNDLESIDRLRRDNIVRRLPGIDETYYEGSTKKLLSLDLFQKILEDRNLLPSLERFWLHEHPEKAKAIERANYEKFVKGELHKYNFRSKLLKVKALEEIGIFDFLTRDDWFSGTDNHAVKILRKAQKSETYKLAFGRNPGNTKGVVAFLRESLERIGCTLESTRVRGNGKRQYWYKVRCFWEDSTLSSVYHFTVKRMELLYARTIEDNDKRKEYQKKVAEMPAPQGFEAHPSCPIYNDSTIYSKTVYGTADSQPKTWREVLGTVSTELFMLPPQEAAASISELFKGIIKRQYPAPPVSAWYDGDNFSEQDIAHLEDLKTEYSELDELFEDVLSLEDYPDE